MCFWNNGGFKIEGRGSCVARCVFMSTCVSVCCVSGKTAGILISRGVSHAQSEGKAISTSAYCVCVCVCLCVSYTLRMQQSYTFKVWIYYTLPFIYTDLTTCVRSVYERTWRAVKVIHACTVRQSCLLSRCVHYCLLISSQWDRQEKRQDLETHGADRQVQYINRGK